MKDIDYGSCDCGASLLPVWFTEEERIVKNGVMHKTGRVRRACSHLYCPICGRQYCVDDSFDLPWRYSHVTDYSYYGVN